MSNKTHLGWANTETWRMALWLNDDPVFNQILRMSQSTKDLEEYVWSHVFRNVLGPKNVSWETDVLQAELEAIDWEQIYESAKEDAE